MWQGASLRFLLSRMQLEAEAIILEYLREHESIAVHPFGVLWVVVHDLVEENVGNRCHTPTILLANNPSC